MWSLVFNSIVCVYLCMRKIFRILLWQQYYKLKQKGFLVSAPLIRPEMSVNNKIKITKLY